jgi:hypothetical protein
MKQKRCEQRFNSVETDCQDRSIEDSAGIEGSCVIYESPLQRSYPLIGTKLASMRWPTLLP